MSFSSKFRTAATLPLFALLAFAPTADISPGAYPLPGGPAFKLLTWDAYSDLFLDLVVLKENSVIGVQSDVLGYQELPLPGVTAAALLEKPGDHVVVVGAADVYELYRDDNEGALAFTPWDEPTMGGSIHVTAMPYASMHLVVFVDATGNHVHCYRLTNGDPVLMASWEAPGPVEALALAQLPGWPGAQVVLLTDQVLEFRTVAGAILAPAIPHLGDAVLAVMSDAQGNPRQQVAMASKDAYDNWNLAVYNNGLQLQTTAQTSSLPFLQDHPIAMLSGDFNDDNHPDLAFKTPAALYTLANNGIPANQFGSAVGAQVRSYGAGDTAIPAVASFTRDGTFQIADELSSAGGLVFSELVNEEDGGTPLIELIGGSPTPITQATPPNPSQYTSLIQIPLRLGADLFDRFLNGKIQVVIWRLPDESVAQFDPVAEHNFVFDLPQGTRAGDYSISVPFDALTEDDPDSGEARWPNGERYWLQTRLVQTVGPNSDLRIVDASPRRMLALGLEIDNADTLSYLINLNHGTSILIKQPPMSTNKRVGIIIEPDIVHPVVPGVFPEPPQPPQHQGDATVL